MTPLRFAPIVRVSTEKQEEQGESLRVQEAQIKAYVQALDGVIPDSCWQYRGQEHATPQYERAMIKKLLDDSSKGLFDAVICVDPSRWSRDNQKSKDGLNILRANGIKFFVGTTEYDLFNPTANLFLGMSAEIGEFQAMEQSRKSILSRIARARRGIPTAGELPYGRTWDEQSGWKVDTAKKQLLEQAAKRYVEGNESIRQIAATIGMPFPTLWKYLTKVSGDAMTLHFSNKRLNINETVDIQIPELLDKKTIEAIKERAITSQSYRHGHIKNKYLLGRMIFCKTCGYAMSGSAHTNNRRYYRHPHDFGNHCIHKFVPANDIENAVLLQLIRTYGDPELLQKAVARATPSIEKREILELEMTQLESQDAKLTKKRNNIVDSIGDGTISKGEADYSMKQIRSQQTAISDRLDVIRRELLILPDPERIKRLSQWVGKILFDISRFQPQEIFTKSFEWKRSLVERAFAGVDHENKRLGVYIEETGDAKQPFAFEIRGTLETSLMNLPLSDETLIGLFHLDSDYMTPEELEEKLIKIRDSVTTYTQQTPLLSPSR